jgi:hypothetical protein
VLSHVLRATWHLNETYICFYDYYLSANAGLRWNAEELSDEIVSTGVTSSLSSPEPAALASTARWRPCIGGRPRHQGMIDALRKGFPCRPSLHEYRSRADAGGGVRQTARSTTVKAGCSCRSWPDRDYMASYGIATSTHRWLLPDICFQPQRLLVRLLPAKWAKQYPSQPFRGPGLARTEQLHLQFRADSAVGPWRQSRRRWPPDSMVHALARTGRRRNHGSAQGRHVIQAGSARAADVACGPPPANKMLRPFSAEETTPPSGRIPLLGQAQGWFYIPGRPRTSATGHRDHLKFGGHT